MSLSTALLIAAPSFHQPETGLEMLATAGILGGVIGFVLGFCLVGFNLAERNRFSYSGLAIMLLAVGFFIWTAVLQGRAVDSLHSERTVEITSWLDDQYDVKVTEVDLELLLDGEAIGVDLDGEYARIEFAERSDGTILVIDSETSEVLPRS